MGEHGLPGGGENCVGGGRVQGAVAAEIQSVSDGTHRTRSPCRVYQHN